MITTRRSMIQAGAAFLVGLRASSALAKPIDNGHRFEGWRKRFEETLPSRMAEAQVPGLAVAIASRDSDWRYTAAFGYADISQQRKFFVDTPSHLASVSKLFTASALVQLFDRKGLGINDDLNRFIDFSVRNPHHPDVPITVRHLLTHTSSISDEGYKGFSTVGDSNQSLSSFVHDYLSPGGPAYAAETSFLQDRPGTRWSYSNVAIALAGYIIESVSGQSFPSYIQENIFEPLGLHNAKWILRDFGPDIVAKPYRLVDGKLREQPHQGYPDVPAGMLRCSVTDLAKAVHAMLNKKPGQNPVLSPRMVDLMLTRQVDPGIRPYQGLGWCAERINNQLLVGHYGGDAGASTGVFLRPDRKYAAIVIMNVAPDPKVINFKSAIIGDLLAGSVFA